MRGTTRSGAVAGCTLVLSLRPRKKSEVLASKCRRGEDPGSDTVAAGAISSCCSSGADDWLGVLSIVQRHERALRVDAAGRRGGRTAHHPERSDQASED